MYKIALNSVSTSEIIHQLCVMYALARLNPKYSSLAIFMEHTHLCNMIKTSKFRRRDGKRPAACDVYKIEIKTVETHLGLKAS